MVIPWFIACERRICCAQAGGLPGDADEAAGAALAPPTVPMDELPPVAPSSARAPSVKLDWTDWLARAAARLSGEMAAEPAARATPPTPEATPPVPVWP